MSSAAPAIPSIEEAYRTCAEVTRREGKNFAVGFLFLPRPQRRSMNALYAYARATDDLVDDESIAPVLRAARIAAWERASRAAFEGKPSWGLLAEAGIEQLAPAVVAMAHTAAEHAVPADELLLLVEGCREDLEPRRYASWDDTLLYCRKVAVTVGMAMLAIFHGKGSAERAAMESIGYAFQLTNILRDIPEDAARGRIYLPLDILGSHGVVERELAAGPPGPSLRRALAEVGERAEAYYAEALPLQSLLAPGAARTMRAMHGIYQAILAEIRARDYDVWSARPRLSGARKLQLLARAAFLP